MRVTAVLLLLLAAFAGSVATAAEHYVYATIGVCDTWSCSDPLASAAWHSGAWVESRLLGIPYVVGMRNDDSIYMDNSVLVTFRKQEGFWSDWHSYLLGGTLAGHCYNAHLTSTAGTAERAVPSSPFIVCWYGPPTPPPDKHCVPVWDPEGEVYQENCDTPILLRLNDGAYELTSANDGVLFDIRADGRPRYVAWTARGSDIAFLAMDRNANGHIDSGAELFGSATPLASGVRAQHGFQSLSELDDNADGVLDRRDRVWPALLLWTDRDHDGITSPGELKSLVETSVEWVSTSFETINKKDRWSNVFRYMSRFGMWSGTGEATIQKQFFDVMLRSVAH